MTGGQLRYVLDFVAAVRGWPIETTEGDTNRVPGQGDTTMTDETNPPCPTCRSTDWVIRAGLRCNCCLPEESANQAAKGERRPKVGDRVRFPLTGTNTSWRIQSDRVSISGFWIDDGHQAVWCWTSERGKIWDFADGEAAKPAPDGMTEREQEAWEIQNSGLMAGCGFMPIPWPALEKSQRREALAARDKAAEIFGAKADDRVRRAERIAENWKKAQASTEFLANKRAGELREALRARDTYKASQDSAMQCWGQCAKERDEARRIRDEYRASHDKAMEMLAEVQKERDCHASVRQDQREAMQLLRHELTDATEETNRLTARNAELVAVLREACGSHEGVTLGRALLARIDAEAAAKPTAGNSVGGVLPGANEHSAHAESLEETLDKITKHLNELEVELPWILKAYRDRRAGMVTETAALAAAEDKGRREMAMEAVERLSTESLSPAARGWLREKAFGK